MKFGSNVIKVVSQWDRGGMEENLGRQANWEAVVKRTDTREGPDTRLTVR